MAAAAAIEDGKERERVFVREGGKARAGGRDEASGSI